MPYEANQVEQIWQDVQGMIWLVTRQGVFTYDGYNARRILNGNFYAAVAVNRDILCLGSDQGINFLNIKTEQLCDPFGKVPQTGDIRSSAFADGKLYVGTKSSGLFCLDIKNKLWQRYMVSESLDDIIYSIEPVDNGVYIGHLKGLSFIDRKGNVHQTPIRDNVYSVWRDVRRNCLWIGTEHNLLKMNLDNGHITTSLTGSTYNHFLVLKSGKMLLASEYGMLIFNPANGETEIVSHDATAPTSSLPSNRINSFFRDNQNNIWIATDRGATFASQSTDFEYTNLLYFTKSHDGNAFTDVIVDTYGGWWLGGDNGVLHIANGAVKWFRVGNGLRKNMIRALYEDRDHDIWIASDASIARYNRKTDEFDYYDLTDDKGRNSSWAYAVYEDVKGRLWVGTYMGGLYVVDKQSLISGAGSYRMATNPFGRQSDKVNIVYELQPDSNGRVWAYTGQGLAEIDPNTMDISLKRKTFIDGMLVSGGSVWIDKQGKLYRYDIGKGEGQDA